MNRPTKKAPKPNTNKTEEVIVTSLECLRDQKRMMELIVNVFAKLNRFGLEGRRVENIKFIREDEPYERLLVKMVLVPTGHRTAFMDGWEARGRSVLKASKKYIKGYKNGVKWGYECAMRAFTDYLNKKGFKIEAPPENPRDVEEIRHEVFLRFPALEILQGLTPANQENVEQPLPGDPSEFPPLRGVTATMTEPVRTGWPTPPVITAEWNGPAQRVDPVEIGHPFRRQDPRERQDSIEESMRRARRVQEAMRARLREQARMEELRRRMAQVAQPPMAEARAQDGALNIEEMARRAMNAERAEQNRLREEASALQQAITQRDANILEENMRHQMSEINRAEAAEAAEADARLNQAGGFTAQSEAVARSVLDRMLGRNRDYDL